MKALPQARKLQHFVQTWEQLTQDPWILETIQGYKIPFQEQPPVKQIPSFVFSETESKALSAEIEKLLEKQAISPAEATDGFISNVFLVPKKEDQWRLILNLKALNTYTIREHFKMEDIRSVKDLLTRGDYMCKLDLKDAYLSVPISAAHRRYLQFQWEGVTYHSTLWASNRTLGIHKASEACPSSPQGQRPETSSLSGRYPNNGEEQG